MQAIVSNFVWPAAKYCGNFLFVKSSAIIAPRILSAVPAHPTIQLGFIPLYIVSHPINSYRILSSTVGTLARWGSTCMGYLRLSSLPKSQPVETKWEEVSNNTPEVIINEHLQNAVKQNG